MPELSVVSLCDGLTRRKQEHAKAAGPAGCEQEMSVPARANLSAESASLFHTLLGAGSLLLGALSWAGWVLG